MPCAKALGNNNNNDNLLHVIMKRGWCARGEMGQPGILSPSQTCFSLNSKLPHIITTIVCDMLFEYVPEVTESIVSERINFKIFLEEHTPFPPSPWRKLTPNVRCVCMCAFLCSKY